MFVLAKSSLRGGTSSLIYFIGYLPWRRRKSSYSFALRDEFVRRSLTFVIISSQLESHCVVALNCGGVLSHSRVSTNVNLRCDCNSLFVPARFHCESLHSRDTATIATTLTVSKKIQAEGEVREMRWTLRIVSPTLLYIVIPWIEI